MSHVPAFPDNLKTIKLPHISLAKLESGDKLESARLFQACIEHGCFSLNLARPNSHSNPITDVEQVFSIGREYFATPLDEKLKFKYDHRSIGYKPLNTLKVNSNGADSVEVFNVSKDILLTSPSPSALPPTFTANRAVLTSFVNSLLSPISALVLDHISRHLEIPLSTLASLHSPDLPTGTALRFLHYPYTPLPTSADEHWTSFIGHTDNGTLTILFTQIGGLQILAAGKEESDVDAWEWVKPEEGCAFVNIGDSLVQWTGGVLRSVYHRVVRPPGAQAEVGRYSLGYFLKAADDAEMTRIEEGLVPRGEVEGEGEGKGVRHEDWHVSKTKNIFNGINGMTRGGTAEVKWRDECLVKVEGGGVAV